MLNSSYHAELCMKGNIYTLQKCPECDGPMKHDENKDGCFCLVHTGISASKKFVVRFGRNITRNFKDYAMARQFLNGLRFKTAEGTFDERDYISANPLGFEVQALRWLSLKKKKVKHNTYRDYRNSIYKAVSMWGPRNVKTILF